MTNTSKSTRGKRLMIPPINLSNGQNGARGGMEKLYSPTFPVSTSFPGECRRRHPSFSQGNPIYRGGSKSRFRNNQRLWPGKIQQLHIGALLHSLEDNFTPIWRDVEVADVKVTSEVGQLPLGPSL